MSFQSGHPPRVSPSVCQGLWLVLGKGPTQFSQLGGGGYPPPNNRGGSGGIGELAVQMEPFGGSVYIAEGGQRHTLDVWLQVRPRGSCNPGAPDLAPWVSAQLALESPGPSKSLGLGSVLSIPSGFNAQPRLRTRPAPPVPRQSPPADRRAGSCPEQLGSVSEAGPAPPSLQKAVRAPDQTPVPSLVFTQH